MKTQYKIKTGCCAKPAIVTMDYTKATPSKVGPFIVSPRVNRVCTHCWTHWFGPLKAVKRYTSAQWDKWLAAA